MQYVIFMPREFLSTLSLRRATDYAVCYIHAPGISIHALLTESDAVTRVASTPTTVISIHALLTESDTVARGLLQQLIISIHALLTESDHYDNYNLHCVEISIHALLTESDHPRARCALGHPIFLSTLSLRRATGACIVAGPVIYYFYPRSPYGERPQGL